MRIKIIDDSHTFGGRTEWGDNLKNKIKGREERKGNNEHGEHRNPEDNDSINPPGLLIKYKCASFQRL